MRKDRRAKNSAGCEIPLLFELFAASCTSLGNSCNSVWMFHPRSDALTSESERSRRAAPAQVGS